MKWHGDHESISLFDIDSPMGRQLMDEAGLTKKERDDEHPRLF
jgi:hypothetical protein